MHIRPDNFHLTREESYDNMHSLQISLRQNTHFNPPDHCQPHFLLWMCFIMGLGKFILHTKFAIANFSRCRNDKGGPPEFISIVPIAWPLFILGAFSWRASKNAFQHILKAIERSFLHVSADALSSSSSVYMSHLGQGRGLGAIAPCPNVEPRQCWSTQESVFWGSRWYQGSVFGGSVWYQGSVYSGYLWYQPPFRGL